MLEVPAGFAIVAELESIADGVHAVRRVRIWLVGETESDYLHYPGDVHYPKSDWRLASSGQLVPLELVAEAVERAWSDGPGRWWR